MALWVFLSMAILKDMETALNTHAHQDFTRMYHVTRDLRDQLCFLRQFNFATRIKGYSINTVTPCATEGLIKLIKLQLGPNVRLNQDTKV
jgi:hypothetical protein